MLTRRGWLLGVGAVVLVAAGRILGISELFALAAGAVALVAGALVYVHLTRVSLDAQRELHPPRVHAGSPSRVELTVHNRGTRRTPVLGVRDPFDGGRRWARFLLSPLGVGEQARAAYRLPTERRGVYDLGPLEVHLTDPFGVAAWKTVAAAATQLTVFPHVDVIEPLPQTLGHDPHAATDHPTAIGRGGEDFFALRPYEQGDDLRRVHWPTTAKTGELMIRQDEMPWQGRATVVLDVRRSVHTPGSLEQAISAAASIVSAAWRQRSLIRLVATDGVDSGFGAGPAHTEAILEHLATVAATKLGGLDAAVELVRRDAHGGALAVVTTSTTPAGDLQRLSALRGRYGVVLVLFDHGGAPKAIPAVGRLVRVSGQSSFADAWHLGVASGRLLA
ncbi:MAG: hypothetical protein QOE35_1000 [Actinomycetota bacterium]